MMIIYPFNIPNIPFELPKITQKYPELPNFTLFKNINKK